MQAGRRSPAKNAPQRRKNLNTSIITRRHSGAYVGTVDGNASGDFDISADPYGVGVYGGLLAGHCRDVHLDVPNL